MTIERYRLTLEHEYIDDDGKTYKIVDPICTEYYVMRDEYSPPRSVIINEMIDRLRHYILNSVSNGG